MRAFWPAAAAAATGVQVGAAIVATRFFIDQSQPISLALWRYVIGLVCLLPGALSLARMRFSPRDLLPIGLLGIVQFGVVVVLLNLALQLIPAARAALIFATLPLLTMLLGAALRSERLTYANAAGVVLTVVGVGCALGDRAFEPSGAGPAWAGELLALASAFSAALCSVLYRPYLRRYRALPVGTFAMLASVVFLAMLASTEGFFASPPQFTPSGWLALLFIGVSSAAGYLLWLWALDNITPTRATVFLALSPITAAVLGTWWLAEPASPLLLLGMATVGLGLWLAQGLPVRTLGGG